MSRPRIGVDADGVLYDFHAHCLRIINRIRSEREPGFEPLEADANVDWDFVGVLGPDPMTEVEFRHRLNIERTAALLRTLPTAKALLEVCARYGDVWVVTSPMHTNQTWQYDRLVTLAADFGIDRHRVCFASDKSCFDGRVLIDDKASNLRQWEDGARNTERRGILWEQPWSGEWAGWRCWSTSALEQALQQELCDGR